MKKLKYIIRKLNSIAVLTFVLSFLILTSCEEVIEIDLNSSNSVLVAEGQIEKDSAAWLRLSYTIDYFNNEKEIYEENATVVLTDKNNNSETLVYVGNGLYKGNLLLGKVDEKYSLSIITDNEYTAVSALRQPSEIYEIEIEESDMQKPGQKDVSYSLRIKFADEPVVENFYLIKLIINNELDSYVLLDDNVFLVGDTINYPLIRKSFLKDDKVIINIYSVDKDTYRYYTQLNDAVSGGNGPGGTSTPYNSISNFGKDVMGYFAAWSYVSDTIVIN